MSIRSLARQLPTAWMAGLVLIATPPVMASEVTNLDELVARHQEARGGAEHWQRVESLSLSGPFTAFSEPGSFELHHTAEGRYYYARDEGSGVRVVTGTNGERHWQVQPLFGDWPTALEGSDLVVLQQELEFPNPFFHLDRDDLSATFQGSGDLDGVPALVAELTRGNGQTETWYFDPNTYLELGRRSQGSDFGRPASMTTFYDDFREVQGLQIPHYVEQQWYTRNRIFEIETVTLDGDLDDALFELPVAKGMERFHALAGEWSVAVESRQSPQQAEMSTSERTATLESHVRGGLLQERYETAEGTPVVRQVSYDRFREVYRLTQINGTNTYLDIQEGNFDEEGRLVTSNLETDSGWRMVFGNMTINERNTWVFEPGRMVIETEFTTDAGANWFLGRRETFTRPTP